MIAALYEALYTQPRLFCWVSAKPDGYHGQCENTIANKRMDYNN